MKQSFKSNHNGMYSCQYHVVFCPKYRRKVLSEAIAQRLTEIVQTVAEETGSQVLQIEVLPDQVPRLCEVDPQLGIHKFVRLVKGRSSRLLRQEFPALKSRLPTLWTNSVFCATVGG